MPIQTIDRGTAGNTGDTFKVGVAFDTCQDNDEYLDLVKAPLASPALTGTPTAPTAAANTSTTQIATTAFVQGEVVDRVQIIDTFAALATTAAATSGVVVYIKQHTSGGLGGGYFQDTAGTITNNGGTLINNTVTAGRHWKRINYTNLSPVMFGAMMDDINDDTSAANACALALLKLGGGVVYFEPQGRSYIAGKIYLCSDLLFDLNGSVLRGTGNASGSIFETATFNGSSVVSNIGSAPETQLVKRAGVQNGKIIDSGIALNCYNAVQGCHFKDLVFENCRQSWKMDRCFYSQYSNIVSTVGSDVNYPTYWFAGSNNAHTLDRVTAGTEYSFLFEGGTAAVNVSGCTSEGGTKGFVFTGEVYGLVMESCYFEAVITAIDISGCSDFRGSFMANYFNYVDVVIKDGSTSAAPFCRGLWDSGNFIANIGGILGSTTYRGRMEISGRGNFIDYRAPDGEAGTASAPANWVTSKNTRWSFEDVWKATSVTDYRQRAIITNSIIPVHRSGDAGISYTGSIPYCTIGTLSASTTIDTAIIYRPNVSFIKFSFSVSDGSGVSEVYGDIFGVIIKRADATAVTLTASDNGGFLRLTLGFISPPYNSITGSIQLLG